MSHTEILLLAIILSVDACIVSFSYGLVFIQNRIKNSCSLGFFTGLFQGLMPLIAYYLTSFIKNYIEPFAPIIIFTIFVFLGSKFIKEAFNETKEKPICIDIPCLLLIGIATSIDAFSAGISLALSGNTIIKPAILISLITFINANLGFWLGGRLKNLPTKWMEISSGIVLILLGIKAIL